MTTAFKTNRSRPVAMVGIAATLAVAALAFAGAAQARDNVYWSVGVGTPGVGLNVGNVGSVYPQPVYPQPVYVQQAPVYVQPAPVYVQPRPVYVQPRPVYGGAQPVYLAPPPPVYYGNPYHHRRPHWNRGGYPQGAYQGYGPGYDQVYYQRDGRGERDEYRHDGRR